MSWIDVVWVLLWSIQLDEMLIQYPALEVRIQNLCLLLFITSHTMELISVLELFLDRSKLDRFQKHPDECFHTELP